MFDDFDKVKMRLLEVCKETGFFSLEDAMNLLIGQCHKEHIESLKQENKELSRDKKSDTPPTNTTKQETKEINNWWTKWWSSSNNNKEIK